MRIRASLAALGLLPPLLPFACGAPDAKPAVVAPRPTPGVIVPDASAEGPMPPLQYVLSESTLRSPTASVPLSTENATGVLLDGLRIVVKGALSRAAKDMADQPLVAAYAVPSRLGGGYLFRTHSALYLADTWDGALKPVVSTPSDIVDVAFGPKALHVRGDGGERWAVSLPSGARATVAPVGMLDIGALDDGRAAAIAELGKLLVSTDAGATWKDVTAQLRARPDRIVAKDGMLDVVLANNAAVRVEAGGQLVAFDHAPEIKPKTPKEKDPRWRSDEAPSRRAIRLGAPLDEQTALVVDGGDIFRVHVPTGDILGVTPGKLPPDATCEAVKVEGDVVFVCARPNNVAFVASHTLGDKQPVIEQTFAAPGVFYVGDDGGIAFGGPCSRSKASKQIVCVRGSQGAWQEYDLEVSAGDGGAPLDVARWIPRADGGAIGIVVGSTWGVVDARTGELRAWAPDQLSNQLRAALQSAAAARHYGYGAKFDSTRVADRSWSVTSNGTIRGWASDTSNSAFELSLDGTVTPSPFSFDRVMTAGPFALARTRDGRVWQSLDRGVTWSEVAAPLAAKASGSVDLRSCSAVGCDLGAWYRLGWTATAPMPPLALATASPPPEIKREPMPQLSCKPAGDVKKTVIAQTESSPADLGLGANRIAVSDEKGNREYLRITFGRSIANPLRGTRDADESFALRALVHGPATHVDDDGKLVVTAPAKDIHTLKRQLFFVAPFDPAGIVQKSALGSSDVLTAARAIGSPTPSDYLLQDPALVTAVVPLASTDPTAADDALFVAESGIVAAARGSKAKVSILSRRLDDGHYVSAASIAADEFAVLEVDGAGKERIVRVGAQGAVPVFELPPVPSQASFAANLDAVAVGPKGELGILRTPSASEPSSAFDTAMIVSSGGAITALAPWSTLTPADDPACKADAGGWRVTFQTIAPWVRLAGIDTSANEEISVMLARVRWSPTRACLEAIELRADELASSPAPGVDGFGLLGRRSLGSADVPIENWVVARFSGNGGAGRVGVVPGAELRQPMSCSLGGP